jgi:lysophospholipase L1-like esterase
VAAAAPSGDSVPAPKNESPGQPAELFDYTHLGAKGSAFFGRMVAAELVRAVPDLRRYFRP